MIRASETEAPGQEKKMKRTEILERLHIRVPENSFVPVIIDTDAKNEADDQYAIMHHLLSPKLKVLGIVAAHYESKAATPGTTMEKSCEEVLRVLGLAEIEDVPVYRGCKLPLQSIHEKQDAPGVQFMIEEARKADGKIFIAAQGAMTNVASAINTEPDIAEKIIILWNGGGPYPKGRAKFNVMQDPDAVRAVLAGGAEIWQTPQDVYASLEVSLAELSRRVRPCGKIGAYLYEQLTAENLAAFRPEFLLRSGENWTLGDNTTAAVLLMNVFRGNWHMEHAPLIKEDLTYAENPNGKMIRVYDSIDVRFTLEDFFSKLELAYKQDTL